MANTLQTLSVYYDESFVNYQGAGRMHKSNEENKLFIELKPLKKRYLVRFDKDKKTKYVIINKTKVLLKSIKGKFKYVQSQL